MPALIAGQSIGKKAQAFIADQNTLFKRTEKIQLCTEFQLATHAN